MDELRQIESMGLVMPSPAYLLGAILFGLIGYAAFRRGRRTSGSVLIWAGLALMLYPYAVSPTGLFWVIGVVLSGWVYAKWN